MSDPLPPPPSTSTTNSTTTFLSSTYLSSIPPDSTADLQTFLDAQARLEVEAKEVMPFKTGECSWERGYVKQSVWACKDCEGKGVCYGCSIACHAEHELVELFQRRAFRCDCPAEYSSPSSPSSTTSTPANPSTKCTIIPTLHPKNISNKYTKNFQGRFCRCKKGENYDPMEEEESMVSCLGCEDWFHEGCLNLYDPSKPPPVDGDEDEDGVDLDEPLPTPTTATTTTTTTTTTAASTTTTSNVQVDNALQATPTPTEVKTLPPPNPSLLSPNAYAHLICAGCIKGSTTLKRLAGTRGWMMIIAREGSAVGGSRLDSEGKEEELGWGDKWEVVGKEDVVRGKRKADVVADENDDDDDEEARKMGEGKRIKLGVDSGTQAVQTSTIRCRLPPPSLRAQAVFAQNIHNHNQNDDEGSSGKGDVFLTQGQRERLRILMDCSCPECTAGEWATTTPPFPLSEEDEGEVYEPPRDEEEDEVEETIEEMTARTLNHLPRSQAIETMIKFNEMKDQLKLFLEGFRGGDRVVKEEDIRAFVDGMREQADKR